MWESFSSAAVEKCWYRASARRTNGLYGIPSFASGIPGRLNACDRCGSGAELCEPQAILVTGSVGDVGGRQHSVWGLCRPDRIPPDLGEELRLLGRHASAGRPADDAEQLVGAG